MGVNTFISQTNLESKSRSMLKKTRSRFVVQTSFFIVTIIMGFRFYFYVQQAADNGLMTLSRPAGVEGFLPIGALLAWKRFILTGQWDTIHPAAMVIFGYALFISFVFHKAFCSWICPIGTLSEWTWKFSNRILVRTFSLPKCLDLPLRSLKYLLLAFFIWVVGNMSVMSITMFIEAPYYKVSDVKMLRFFTHMSLTTALVLAILVLGSLLIKNFWCRYLCPYGALTGLLGMLGPTKITRNESRCIGCKKCTESCPHQINVHEKQFIFSPECSSCMDCVTKCPVEKTLTLKTSLLKLHFDWNGRLLGTMVSLVFVFSYFIAAYTGHWESQLPESEFRQLLELIDSPLLTHPSI